MSCGCPQNYQYNQQSGLCEQPGSVPAILNSRSLAPDYVCVDPINMRSGTVIYPDISVNQFPLSGLNTVVPSFQDAAGNIINPFSTLVTGSLWISGGSAANGRLNQAGIGLFPPVNEWQGYSRCIDVNENDKISVALSSTYGFRLFVDGVLAIVYTPIFPVRAADYLHVFPLVLSPGLHNFLFEGISGSTSQQCFDINNNAVECTSVSAIRTDVVNNCSSLGAFVCEIYKNITSQILSTIYDQDGLDDYYATHAVNGIDEAITTIFLRGGATDTGSHGNYICPNGYLTDCVSGAFYCNVVNTAPYINCCFNLINCVTGNIIVTNTDLNLYLGKTIKINEQSGCYLINVNSDVACAGAVAVTVKAAYATCELCNKIYYKLIDCNGEVDPINTSVNLSAYVGKIVKLSGYNACWIVVITSDSTNLKTVSLTNSYNTCEECS